MPAAADVAGAVRSKEERVGARGLPPNRKAVSGGQARPPGGAARPARAGRACRTHRRQLPLAPVELALQVAERQLGGDALLEASDGVSVKCSRRTRRDGWYTGVRHGCVSLGREPRNADLLEQAGRTKSPRPGGESPEQGLFVCGPSAR